MNFEIKVPDMTHKVILDIIWELGSKEEVEKFISSLPPKYSLIAISLVDILIARFLDEVDETEEANMYLKKFNK